MRGTVLNLVLKILSNHKHCLPHSRIILPCSHNIGLKQAILEKIQGHFTYKLRKTWTINSKMFIGRNQGDL